jgi:hypothetical protein
MKHQRDRIRVLFKTRPNQWIPLYELMRYAAQYNTRISELRAEGMNIINKEERLNGENKSWYMYIPSEDSNGQGLFPLINL